MHGFNFEEPSECQAESIYSSSPGISWLMDILSSATSKPIISADSSTNNLVLEY